MTRISTRITRTALAGTAALALSVSPAWAADITWDAGGADQNWSTFDNFSDNLDPTGDNVLFGDAGAHGTAGTVTSIVDADVSIGTLSFQNTTGNTHTIQINEDRVLTITAFRANTLATPDGVWLDNQTVVHFTGDGELNFNNASGTFLLGSNQSQQVGSRNPGVTTIDMGSLATFTAVADVIRMEQRTRGDITWTMAASNSVTATRIDIGTSSQTDTINLGQENILNVDILGLSDNNLNETSSIMKFTTGLIDPTVIIRNKAGTGGANLNMTWNGAGGGANPGSSTLDLRGGDVDALFDVIQMSQSRAGASLRDATILLDTGTVQANSILMGATLNTHASGNAIDRATIDLSGTAVVTVGTIKLADVTEGTTGKNEAFIKLADSATLRAQNIVAGATSGAGNAGSIRRVEFTAGTLGNIAGSNLTVDALIDIQLIGAGTHNFDITANQSGTIQGAITESTGPAGLTKTGAGTLVLNGANSYTGTTLVSEGTLGGSGSIAGDLSVAAGAKLAPGNSPGTFTVGGDVTLAGGFIYDWEYGDSVKDLVLILGTLDLSAANTIASTINLINAGGTIADGDILFTAANITGAVSGDTLNWSIVGGSGITAVVDGNNVVLSIIPEPATVLLALAGGLLILPYRGRRGWAVDAA